MPVAIFQSTFFSSCLSEKKCVQIYKLEDITREHTRIQEYVNTHKSNKPTCKACTNGKRGARLAPRTKT